jgi:hypothetical protein
MSFLVIIILFVSGCQSEYRQSQSLSGQLPIKVSPRLEPNELTKIEQIKEKKAQLDPVNPKNTVYKQQLYLFNSFKTNSTNDIQSDDRGRNTKGSGIDKALDKNKGSKIGILLPLSGSGEEDGRAFLDAMQLAFFEVANESLELYIADTNGSPAGAAESVQKLIAEDVGLILGPLFSGSTDAIAPFATAAQIPVISFSNNIKVARTGVFVFGFLPDQQIVRILKYASKKDYRRVATFAPANAFGELSVSVARGIINETDQKLVSETLYDPNTPNLNQLVREFSEYDNRKQRLKRQKTELKRQSDEIANDALARLSGLDTLGDPSFDAILLPSGGSELLTVAPLLAFYDVDPSRIRLLGSSLWDRINGLNLEPSLMGAWYAAPEPKLRLLYEAKFKDMFGYSPPRLSSLAYDAMLLGVNLISEDKEWDDSLASITDPSGFRGVDGIVRLLNNGSNERGLAILEVGRGGIKVIDDAPSMFFKHN